MKMTSSVNTLCFGVFFSGCEGLHFMIFLIFGSGGLLRIITLSNPSQALENPLSTLVSH